jgi:hypothetical protein
MKEKYQKSQEEQKNETHGSKAFAEFQNRVLYLWQREN